ncbi:MAG: galactose mutarotase [Prevotellaceae bacterium]|jgi:aldose 1-epimerase|nr:galactose mutarotase [Prevotellaceae bacterium]
MNAKILTLAAVATLGVCSCGSQKSNNMEITKAPFGTYEGQEVQLYTLSNGAGMSMKVATYGGTITELYTPDRNGAAGNITLGFPTLDGYRSEAFFKVGPYFGALIGRYGNRIGQAKFTLDGKEYKLAANNGRNHLHGGLKGFDKAIWNAEEIKGADSVGLKLSYLSKDGEEGYPGNLSVQVTYLLTKNNELKIQYSATTDKLTLCNLTNHAYFNLAAGAAPDAMGHELTIFADKFTEADGELIPTGKSLDVKGTPFDFTTPHVIGERIDADNAQLKSGGGYDHNWELNAKDGKLSLAAQVYEPLSGRTMEVYTTEPGVQFYAGNFLDGNLYGVDSARYVKRYGFCLETQHFPDSPHHSAFPSTELKPGQTYASETVYKFGVKK